MELKALISHLEKDERVKKLQDEALSNKVIRELWVAYKGDKWLPCIIKDQKTNLIGFDFNASGKRGPNDIVGRTKISLAEMLARIILKAYDPKATVRCQYKDKGKADARKFFDLEYGSQISSIIKSFTNGITSNLEDSALKNEPKNGASIDSESLKLNSPTFTEDEEFLEAVIVEAEAEQASIEDINRLVAIKTRRGQPEFRRALLKAYDGRCCITGCNVEDVLEAAHIISHSEETNYLVMNGLLLRADIHTLFDLHLIRIDERNRIMVSVKLKESDYQKFDGLSIRLPSKLYERPKQDFLLRRLKIMGTCTV